MPTASRESASTRDMRGSARTRGKDAEIATLADQQHGVVARGQLVDIGVGEDAIDRRIEAGRLHPLHLGVYAIGHRVVSREGRWMAAVLACGPGAVLSHRSAAALWGIRKAASETVDVALPRRSRSSRAIRRHVTVVPDDERDERDGIPVTTAARTLLDLAASSPIDAVERDLRELEYLRLTDRVPVVTLLDRYRGRRGTRRLRLALECLDDSPGHLRSPLEQRFLGFLDRYDLPRPQFNVWIPLPVGHVQVDCLWPETGNVVELDGWQAHGTRAAFKADRTRDRRLRLAGYAVTRLTWTELSDEPGAIARDLRQLLNKCP